MIEPFLKSQLEPVARRQRQWRLQWQLALCWGLAAACGFLLIWLERLAGASVPGLMLLLALAAGLGSLLVWRRASNWQPDFRQIARQIEQHHPDLHALLLTAVEQQPDESGKFNYLQERVIQEAAAQNQKHQWIETISRRRLLALEWMQLCALIALVFALFGLRSTARITAQSAKAAAANQQVTVTPGDTSIERGSAL